MIVPHNGRTGAELILVESNHGIAFLTAAPIKESDNVRIGIVGHALDQSIGFGPEKTRHLCLIKELLCNDGLGCEAVMLRLGAGDYHVAVGTASFVKGNRSLGEESIYIDRLDFLDLVTLDHYVVGCKNRRGCAVGELKNKFAVLVCRRGNNHKDARGSGAEGCFPVRNSDVPVLVHAAGLYLA